MPDTCPPSKLAAIDAAHHLHPFADIRKLNAYWPEIDRIRKARNILLWQWGSCEKAAMSMPGQRSCCRIMGKAKVRSAAETMTTP